MGVQPSLAGCQLLGLACQQLAGSSRESLPVFPEVRHFSCTLTDHTDAHGVQIAALGRNVPITP
jgi:hypothetical protein